MVIGIIPARYDSTRLLGKLLADINGREVLERTWLRAQVAKSLDRLIIAAGDEKIASAARSFGAEVVEVYEDLPSGSDRIWRAAQQLEQHGASIDIIVNIQGDEPFLDPEAINAVVKRLQDDPLAGVATPVSLIQDEDEYLSSSAVKVVLDDSGTALYFSRAPIPFSWSKDKSKAYRHIGLYAYRRSVLEQFVHWSTSPLEKVERLEQLRLLHFGVKIVTVLIESGGIGIDTVEDLIRARQISNNIAESDCE